VVALVATAAASTAFLTTCWCFKELAMDDASTIDHRLFHHWLLSTAGRSSNPTAVSISSVGVDTLAAATGAQGAAGIMCHLS